MSSKKALITGITGKDGSYLPEFLLAKGYEVHGLLDWEKDVEVDPRYYRPAEVDYLQGDASKAAEKLGWRHKASFDLVRTMVDGDIELLKDELAGLRVRVDR